MFAGGYAHRKTIRFCNLTIVGEDYALKNADFVPIFP
jgi:hypothetical protein